MEGNLYEDSMRKKAAVSVVGLGYVGIPIAIAFAEKGVRVIGFDLDRHKIGLYQAGTDPTQEVGDDAIRNTTIDFTCDEARLREARFHIVAVPTPVNQDHTPDLSPVICAGTMVGRNLCRGSVVVFESTVYPDAAGRHLVNHLTYSLAICPGASGDSQHGLVQTALQIL